MPLPLLAASPWVFVFDRQPFDHPVDREVSEQYSYAGWAQRTSADASVIRVAPPITEMASSLWLLTHPDLRQMPRVRAVLDAIADFLSKVRPKIEVDATTGTRPSTFAALPRGHWAPDSE
jgi:hypothetical protein